MNGRCYIADGAQDRIDASAETVTPAAFPDLYIPIAAVEQRWMTSDS